MNIIFMGTADFSLKSLVAIHRAGFNIGGVYTQRPKPSGRNYKVQKSAVHQYAEENNIPVYCPKNFRSQEEVEFFRSLNPTVTIVSSYGLIIPQTLLEIPRYGFINIHASLLPRWRGAAPIQAAILAGDTKTGITIMKMDAGIDTGDIISMKSVDIFPETTHGELADKMGNLGAEMIVETLHNIEESLAKSQKQPEEGSTYAKKIDKDSCKINWNNSAENILRSIKAFSPVPAAWTEIDGIRIKIIDAEVVNVNAVESGIISEHMIISCGIGSLKLTKIQPAGKGEMSGDAFICGRKNLVGSRLVFC